MMLAVLFAAVLVSCDEDTPMDDGGVEEPAELTAEAAKASIEAMSTDMEADLVEMVESDGVDALTELLDLVSEGDLFSGRVDPNMASKEIIASRLKGFKNAFIPVSTDLMEDDGFVLADNYGVYEYNAALDDFEQVSEGGNNMTINFPTEGSATNNASLILSVYEEISIETIEDGYTYVESYPSSLEASLSIDDVELVSLDLKASYSADGFPLSANIALELTPFIYTVAFEDSETLSSSGSINVTKDGGKIIGTSVAVEFLSAEKEEPSTITGEVYYLTTSIRGNIDLSSIDSEDDVVDLNDLINIELYSGESKIGDIVVEETEDELLVDVQYADGTTESLEDLLSPVLDELEDFICELEGGDC